MKRKKLTDYEILLEIYRKVYAVSEPPADFDELVANAELNDRGEKVIKFLDYECEHDTMQRILDETIAKYKIKGHRAKAFAFSFWLGCSPKTKQKS
jgi:hypothetical protein